MFAKGARKPRLITNKAKPRFYTKLIATTVNWHGYENPLQNTWTIDYYQEKDKKNMRKYNRMQKKRTNQANKLSNYLTEYILGKKPNSTTTEADQLKDIMKTLGLQSESMDFEKIVQNEEQAQRLKQQIIILIMKQDSNGEVWSQVDGMISEIEKDKGYSITHNKSEIAKKSANVVDPKGKDEQLFKSVFSSLKTMHDDPSNSSARMMKVVPTVKSQVRSRLQKAFQEAESATFLNQLYQDNQRKS